MLLQGCPYESNLNLWNEFGGVLVECLVGCLVECLRTPTPAQPLMYKGSPKVLGGVLGDFYVTKKLTKPGSSVSRFYGL